MRACVPLSTTASRGESMKRSTLTVAVLVGVLGLVGTAVADAPEPREIEVGKALAGSVSGDEEHGFVLELEEDRVVYGHADQISVDVVVTVYGPDEEQVTRVDVSGEGRDEFQFDAEQAGTYRIVVQGFEEQEGDFTLTVEGVEAIATDPAKRVDQLMRPYDRPNTPGGVVAVVEGGEISFAKAYGSANLSHDVPFTRETVTNIGSTSKQFTAFGILLLDAAGKLSIDDDVRKHVPELPDFGETVTIRHLMTHTSGYREFLNAVAIGGRRLDQGDYIDPDEILELVKRQPELQNTPGSEWNYNNTAFSLLTTIIERVTDLSFPEYMKERVFDPLGMKHTSVRAHRMDVIRNSAQGYVPAAKGFREAVDLGASMGAGGIYTTVDDLARWVRNFKTGELGGPEMFKGMTTPFVLTDGEVTQYGFGLFVDDLDGLDYVHHGGADSAHRSMLMYFPTLDAAVITQSNNGAFSGAISTEVARLFFGEDTTEGDGEDEEAAAGDASFDPESYDPEDFDALVGRYELEPMPGFILTFTREGDRLFTQATGQQKLAISPVSPTTFKLDVVDARVEFHVGEDGTASELTLHQNGQHKAKRLEEEAWEPDAEALEAYVGSYFSEELEAFYAIAVEDGKLSLRHRRWGEREMTASKEDSFTAGFPVATVDFVRDEDGAVVGFKAGNGRTKDILFERRD